MDRRKWGGISRGTHSLLAQTHFFTKADNWGRRRLTRIFSDCSRCPTVQRESQCCHIGTFSGPPNDPIVLQGRNKKCIIWHPCCSRSEIDSRSQRAGEKKGVRTTTGVDRFPKTNIVAWTILLNFALLYNMGNTGLMVKHNKKFSKKWQYLCICLPCCPQRLGQIRLMMPESWVSSSEWSGRISGRGRVPSHLK